MNMGAGDYDIRVRAIDSRMQTSDWQVTQNGFELKNALPVITAEPVPTVKVQTSTKVSIVENIEDAETDLDQLVITSSSPNFVAWHPATEEIEVYFENIRFVNGVPTASGIEISVDDGTDNSLSEPFCSTLLRMDSQDGLESRSNMSTKHPLPRYTCYHTSLTQTTMETLFHLKI